MENPDLEAAFAAEYDKFSEAMGSNPIYRSLQSISQDVTSVFGAVSTGIEGLCGLYLNPNEHREFTTDLAQTIIKSAATQGLRDYDALAGHVDQGER